MKRKMNNPSWCCKQIQSHVEEWKLDVEAVSVQEIIETIEKIFYDSDKTSMGEDGTMKINKNINDGNLFLFLEKPYLLIYKDADKQIGYTWLQSEKETRATIKTLKECGYGILEAIEIGSCRDVNN